MFENLMNKLGELTKDYRPFDPTSLNDPIAMQTDWKPLRGGGSNFRTEKLVNINSDRVEFKPTVLALMMYSLFLFIGLAITIAFLKVYVGLNKIDSELIIPLLIGSSFAIIGGGKLYTSMIPTVFDKQNGFFWKGRTAPNESADGKQPKKFVELSKIYALQLVSERCHGQKGRRYYSYEINLVLEDGSRINVIDHGNLYKIRTDAACLSEFLNKPLWDATDNKSNEFISMGF